MRCKFTIDTHKEQVVDVHQFWARVEISIVSPLVLGERLATLDPNTVRRLGGFAPWSTPANSADDEGGLDYILWADTNIGHGFDQVASNELSLALHIHSLHGKSSTVRE